MTRMEFEELDSWSDLWDFAEEISCDALCDLIWGDSLDEYVNMDLEDCGRVDWQNLRDWLNDIPEGYEMYRRECSFEYYGVDDDFSYYKEEVGDYADRYGYFEEPEDPEEEDEIVNTVCESSPDNAGVELPSGSLEDLFVTCHNSYIFMVDEQKQERQKEEEAVRAISGNIYASVAV